MQETRRIAWYLFWRTAIAGAILGFVVGGILGFIVGFLGYFVGVDQATSQTASAWVGGLGGLAASFWVLNFFLARTIGKSIEGKRLDLVSG